MKYGVFDGSREMCAMTWEKRHIGYDTTEVYFRRPPRATTTLKLVTGPYLREVLPSEIATRSRLTGPSALCHPNQETMEEDRRQASAVLP